MYVSVGTVMPRLLILLVLCTQFTACTIIGDRRDAPWDPKVGRGIGLDQIQNWEGEANKICGGHLPPNERGGRSPRC
jgi:transposase